MKNSNSDMISLHVYNNSPYKITLPFHGAHGRLTYNLHDKHWIPHIGINNPSNCKADTKNIGYQEIMFFDWKIQLEKLTRDLKDNTILYQGIRLPCKNEQGYCDPTTRTQATIVWFSEETCTVFKVAKIHARMIKFHQKYFIESILYGDVNIYMKDKVFILITEYHLTQKDQFHHPQKETHI